MSGHLIPNLDRPVPVFPLPNLVLFPRAVQFLHLFEQRYRKMFSDLLERETDERLIAIAHLCPGYQEKYHTNLAAIDPILCVALVVQHEQLNDGRYNLMVRGLCRARMVKQLSDGPYRQAMLKGLSESDPVAEPTEHLRLIRNLRQALHEPAFQCLPSVDFCQNLFRSDLSLGDLNDLLAFYLLPADVAEFKQLLLNELDVAERTRMLLRELRNLGRRLEAAARRSVRWPPPSCAN